MKRRTAREVTRRSLLASAGVAAGGALFAATGGASAQAAIQAPATGGSIESPGKYSYPEIYIVQFSTLDMDGDNRILGKIVREFQEANSNVEVEISLINNGDFLYKLVVEFAAGFSADITYLDANLPKQVGHSGYAVDLTDYLKRSEVIDIGDYWERAVFDSIYRDRWYGLPWAPTVATFFYNQDVFEAASYGPVFVEPNLNSHRAPANWDELLEATTLTRKKQGAKIERLGFWHGSSPPAWWLVPYWQQGGQLLSADELTSTIDNEEMALAFQLNLNLIDLQGGWDAMNAFRGDEPLAALFATGRCAMWTDAIDSIQSSKWAETFADINIGVDTFPLAAGGSPAAFRGGGAHIIPILSNLPDNAFEFLEWLYMETNDLRFNDAHGSLPARRSVAHSPEYTQGDPLRDHGVREMERAQGVVSAPGARAIADIHERMANAIWQREQTIPEALTDGNTQVQQALDAALKSIDTRFW